MNETPAVLTVVGIGADGWPGLTGTAAAALTGAEVIFGSSRQLALLPESIAAELLPWPSPLVPALRGLLESRRGRRIAVLASGDPMFHGIGATLVRLLGAAAVRVLPGPSSVSLAAARLGWSLPDVDVLSLVTAPVEELHPLIHPGRKILILSAGAETPAAVAALLTSRGYADSAVTVLSQLGGPAEEVIAGTAERLGAGGFDPLNVVAVACSAGTAASTSSATATVARGRVAGAASLDKGRAVVPADFSGAAVVPQDPVAVAASAGPVRSVLPDGSAGVMSVGQRDPVGVAAPAGEIGAGPAGGSPESGGVGPRPLVAGLPDSVYASDGQLTKREVRAVTLAFLGPQPGELLWDIGAGSGSIAIEWMRTHRDCRAVAVESSAERVGRIVRNAAALGVPKLRVVEGRAPGALAGLPAPDVVFVGGGLTRDGVVEAALAALPAGGRLVANAVTLESEAVLAAWYARLGGELTRIAVNRASPVGGFTGWRAMMPVTIWSVIKP